MNTTSADNPSFPLVAETGMQIDHAPDQTVVFDYSHYAQLEEPDQKLYLRDIIREVCETQLQRYADGILHEDPADIQALQQELMALNAPDYIDRISVDYFLNDFLKVDSPELRSGMTDVNSLLSADGALSFKGIVFLNPNNDIENFLNASFMPGEEYALPEFAFDIHAEDANLYNNAFTKWHEIGHETLGLKEGGADYYATVMTLKEYPQARETLSFVADARLFSNSYSAEPDGTYLKYGYGNFRAINDALSLTEAGIQTMDGAQLKDKALMHDQPAFLGLGGLRDFKEMEVWDAMWTYNPEQSDEPLGSRIMLSRDLEAIGNLAEKVAAENNFSNDENKQHMVKDIRDAAIRMGSIGYKVQPSAQPDAYVDVKTNPAVTAPPPMS